MYEPIITTCSRYILRNSVVLQTRAFSNSPICQLIQNYRKEKGLPMNPNAYGPLTDLPDFTYLDGRPAPFGARQKRRMIKQREIAQKIITLSKEVDFAVDRHEEMLKNEQETKERILENKLKPKGHLLLKEK